MSTTTFVALTDDERALACRHLSGARWLARRYGRRHDPDDAVSAAYLAVCRAAQEWAPERGEFMTVLTWEVRRELMTLVRGARPAAYKNTEKFRRYPRTLSLDALDFPPPGASHNPRRWQLGAGDEWYDPRALDAAVNRLPVRLRMVVRMMHGIGCPVVEAKQLEAVFGVTCERIRRWRNEALALLAQDRPLRAAARGWGVDVEATRPTG